MRVTWRSSSSRKGGSCTLITQNIDELHQIAGNSPDKVIEVHGSMRRFMCWGCGMRGPMQLVLERVRAGEEDPPCRDCGGILKSDTISFGQQLVPEVIDRAMQVAAEGDVFLAVGSTLQVYPVAGAVDIARSAGAKIVIVNAQPAVRRRGACRAARFDQRGPAGNPRSAARSCSNRRESGVVEPALLERLKRRPVAKGEGVIRPEHDLRLPERLHEKAHRARLEHELVVVEAARDRGETRRAIPWPSRSCSMRGPGAASGSTSFRPRG